MLPLADVIASRKLVRTLLVLTALFLLAAALSPTTPLLIAASVALTATTVIPQILIRSFPGWPRQSIAGASSARCKPG